MPHDDVIGEVRAAREAYAKRFNYNPKDICDDLLERARMRGVPLVTLPPRRIAPVPLPPDLAETVDRESR